MAYKSKKQREAEAAIAAAAEAEASTVGIKAPADVLESEVFKREIDRYKRSVGNIPMLLSAILEEQVAVRLLLEGKV